MIITDAVLNCLATFQVRNTGHAEVYGNRHYSTTQSTS